MYGKSVDVFSFGVMMPEILDGGVPYEDMNLPYFKKVEYIMGGGVNRRTINHLSLSSEQLFSCSSFFIEANNSRRHPPCAP